MIIQQFFLGHNAFGGLMAMLFELILSQLQLPTQEKVGVKFMINFPYSRYTQFLRMYAFLYVMNGNV